MATTIKIGDYVVGQRAGLKVEGTVTHVRPAFDDSVLIKAYFRGGSYRDEGGEYGVLSLTPEQVISVNGESNATA